MIASLVVVHAGTPLQNNTKELWALLNFIDPKLFRDMESFLAEFNDIRSEGQVCGCMCFNGSYALVGTAYACVDVFRLAN
jgi:hypothetical protein